MYVTNYIKNVEQYFTLIIFSFILKSIFFMKRQTWLYHTTEDYVPTNTSNNFLMLLKLLLFLIFPTLGTAAILLLVFECYNNPYRRRDIFFQLVKKKRFFNLDTYWT